MQDGSYGNGNGNHVAVASSNILGGGDVSAGLGHATRVSPATVRNAKTNQLPQTVYKNSPSLTYHI